MCSQGDDIARSAMPSPPCEAIKYSSSGMLKDVCEEDYAVAASDCASSEMTSVHSRSPECMSAARLPVSSPPTLLTRPIPYRMPAIL